MCSALALIEGGCDVEKLSPTLYRGPDPSESTLIKLKEMGVKTIVSVRMNPNNRTSAEARKMGLQWIHIPTGVFITPRKPEVDKFLEIVKDPKNQPVYLSCTLGADRTGYYIAMYRMVLEGWENDKADLAMKKQFSKWWPAWYVFHDYRKKVRQFQPEEKNAEENRLVSF